MEIAELRQELADVALQVEVAVASHDTETDMLHDEIADLRRQITELRGYEVEETPLYPEH
jgi:alpha-D-ribose 1-methylphosphonate 5-triphosphate diphosphatase PhnM